MEPALPLILLEGTDGPQAGPPRAGDPRLFDSLDRLLGAVEAPDVRAGIVQAFDAGGHPLRLSAAADAGPVTATLEPNSYPDALRDVLAAAIRSSPHLYPAIAPDRPLEELVAAMWRLEQFARADRRRQRLALYRQVGLTIILLAALVVAQPPVLQPRADVPVPLLLGIWLVVAVGAYWLAGRLLLLFAPGITSADRS
ncbi:MAG TPA: hypothetical protein VE011_08630 [Candidatus Dormibacteraeota bacterium]|nr:hypothetical protein [Candidatus Dormibacteraeota bacterium]